MRYTIYDLRKIGGLLLAALLFCACNGTPPTPRPRGYIRTDFPEKQYSLFDTVGFPYRFEIPFYGQVEVDTLSHGYEPFWINLKMPRYNATIHISYKRIQKNLPALLDDTNSFVYRHVIKADAITETPLENADAKIYGWLYELDGDVASVVQFYATDSTQHFLRGALYFAATPNADSLAPVTNFLKKDIEHLIETLRWK